MSGEREARVLGAGEHFTVDKDEYTLYPVRAQQLCDLERDALKQYKKQYLTTFFDNQEMLGDNAQQKIDAQVEKVAAWDLGNLPQKDAYDIRDVKVGSWAKDPITDEMEFTISTKVYEWLQANWKQVPSSEIGVKSLLVNSLDVGSLTVDKFHELTGEPPIRGRIRYDQWWVTASVEGQVAFISSSINSSSNGQNISRGRVKLWPLPKLTEAAHIVESLTMAQVENM